MNPASIRTASPEDTAVVARVGRETFYETWRPVNSEEDMQQYINEAFDEQKIRQEIISSETNIFFLALIDGETIGYAKMRRDRNYDEFNNEKVIEVERIYVRKECQGKKFGKLLMDHCIEAAKSENCTWIWLGVNEENYTAIRFYRKYGFEVFGTKQFKLGSAIDTDFLMKLRLIKS